MDKNKSKCFIVTLKGTVNTTDVFTELKNAKVSISQTYCRIPGTISFHTYVEDSCYHYIIKGGRIIGTIREVPLYHEATHL